MCKVGRKGVEYTEIVDWTIRDLTDVAGITVDTKLKDHLCMRKVKFVIRVTSGYRLAF